MLHAEGASIEDIINMMQCQVNPIRIRNASQMVFTKELVRGQFVLIGYDEIKDSEIFTTNYRRFKD